MTMDPEARWASRWLVVGLAPVLGLLAGHSPAAPPEPTATLQGLALEGAEAEAYLRTANVVDRKPLGVGVTHSHKLTLSDGTRTLHAAFKTINERVPTARMDLGGVEIDFRDSYRHEVAAYELDKLLGIGLVPPTVEREIDGRTGAVQLWVEAAQTEETRKKKGPEPTNIARWNWQMYKARLLRQLTYDTDFRNIRNLLVDSTFRLYAIDFSRAFRIQRDLLAPDDLECFSRSVLEGLKGLDQPLLQERLGRWLDKVQVDALLARRDRILALAQKRVAERGEGRVLYP
jgi:hypothetical protein